MPALASRQAPLGRRSAPPAAPSRPSGRRGTAPFFSCVRSAAWRAFGCCSCGLRAWRGPRAAGCLRGFEVWEAWLLFAGSRCCRRMCYVPGSPGDAPDASNKSEPTRQLRNLQRRPRPVPAPCQAHQQREKSVTWRREPRCSRLGQGTAREPSSGVCDAQGGFLRPGHAQPFAALTIRSLGIGLAALAARGPTQPKRSLEPAGSQDPAAMLAGQPS